MEHHEIFSFKLRKNDDHLVFLQFCNLLLWGHFLKWSAGRYGMKEGKTWRILIRMRRMRILGYHLSVAWSTAENFHLLSCLSLPSSSNIKESVIHIDKKKVFHFQVLGAQENETLRGMKLNLKPIEPLLSGILYLDCFMRDTEDPRNDIQTHIIKI